MFVEYLNSFNHSRLCPLSWELSTAGVLINNPNLLIIDELTRSTIEDIEGVVESSNKTTFNIGYNKESFISPRYWLQLYATINNIYVLLYEGVMYINDNYSTPEQSTDTLFIDSNFVFTKLAQTTTADTGGSSIINAMPLATKLNFGLTRFPTDDEIDSDIEDLSPSVSQVIKIAQRHKIITAIANTDIELVGNKPCFIELYVQDNEVYFRKAVTRIDGAIVDNVSADSPSLVYLVGRTILENIPELTTIGERYMYNLTTSAIVVFDQANSAGYKYIGQCIGIGKLRFEEDFALGGTAVSSGKILVEGTIYAKKPSTTVKTLVEGTIYAKKPSVIGVKTLVAGTVYAKKPSVIIQPTSNIQAKVLFPKFGNAFININNQEAAKIEIASDGLTITDTYWNTIRSRNNNGYNSGQTKRWSWNTSGYINAPLISYKFDNAMAGMPVNIRIEIMNPDGTMNDVYQLTVQLGGQIRSDINLPSWFGIPQNRLGWDYMDLNSSFPRNWTLPNNKIGIYMGDVYLNMESDGVERILRSGWTARLNDIVPLVTSLPKANKTWITNDYSWINVADNTDTSQWSASNLAAFGGQCGFVYYDGELLPWPIETPTYIAALQQVIATAKSIHPDCYFGAYHTGDYWNINVFDTPMNRRLAYNNIQNQKAIGQLIGLNIGRIDAYDMNNAFGDHLYYIVQMIDYHNISNNQNPLLIFYWHQMQPHPGTNALEYQDMNYKGIQGKVQYILPPAHPNIIYAYALFAFTCADGMLHWGQRGISEDESTLQDWFSVEGGAWSAYIQGYQGTLNYINLAMWQASQNKDIIEANTQWIMPEFSVSNDDGSTWQSWRTGDDIYPSFAQFHKEPVIRVKEYNGNYLIVACNPFNLGLQKVKVRVSGVEIGIVTLVSGFPVLKRI